MLKNLRLFNLNPFKRIREHPRVALPRAASAHLVDEGGKGVAWIDEIIIDAVHAVGESRPLLHTLIEAVLVADVLQAFYLEVGDADVVGHKVSLDEHLVAPALMLF